MPAGFFDDHNVGNSWSDLLRDIFPRILDAIKHLSLVFPAIDDLVEHLDFVIRKLLTPTTRLRHKLRLD
jgi:hypothetical protein